MTEKIKAQNYVILTAESDPEALDPVINGDEEDL
jgi:hypothetical protein